MRLGYFTLTDNQHNYVFTGTLDRPEVKAVPSTEATLQSKP